MDLVFFVSGFFFGLPVFYIVYNLLLQEKDSHEGPFRLKNTFVVFKQTGHVQRAALFDVIRYVYGVYETEITEAPNGFKQRRWVVDSTREEVERWTCPYCLTFWAALVVSIPAAFYSGYSIWLFPIYHMLIVGSGVFWYRLTVDGLRMR